MGSQPQASDDRDDCVGGPTARPCWLHWFLRAHPRSQDPCYLQSHYSLFPFVSMACQPVLMGLYFPLCSSNGLSQPVLAPGVKLPPNRSPVPHLLALLPRAMCAKGQDCGASIPKTQCRDQSSFPIKSIPLASLGLLGVGIVRWGYSGNGMKDHGCHTELNETAAHFFLFLRQDLIT